VARGRFARWVGPELVRELPGRVAKIVAVSGIPSVEIARFAEERGVDLLVLGRKSHSAAARLLLGDTADAVARRSLVPCLFVPAPLDAPKRVLVALDGSARSLVVFRGARNVVEGLGGHLTILVVEPLPGDPRRKLPHFRSNAGIENLRRMLQREGKALRVRHGDVVAKILAGVSAIGASVLAVGYHRGGAPGVVDTGSVARRLAHAAPCAVLTIPL
jgi:nucleotide-binding universal stress UspA family protein